MSRVPPGHHAGGAPLPPMYYQSGVHPGAVPPGANAVHMSGSYVDPAYGGYRPQGAVGAPPMPHPSAAAQFASAPDAYNAMAGPSRDPYGYRTVSAPEPQMGMGQAYETSKSGSGGGQGSASGSTNNDGPSGTSGGGGGGGGQQAGPSEFIKKLYKMLEDESATYGRGKPAGAPRSKGERGSVGWGRGGTSFVVWDMNEFTTKVLPQTFRHSNFSSFVRQLNKYGFSKIKHVDEDTGQIKENVWEFQHPNFQAGGKADLESIKRKAVVPKKGATEESADSPARGLTAEDANRIMDMESRIVGLEDALFKSQEELRDARIRENGIMSVMREIVAHIVSTDKEVPSPPESESPARVRRLFQIFEQVAQTSAVHSHSGSSLGSAPVSAGFAPAYGGSGPMPYSATLPFPPVGRYPVPPLQTPGVSRPGGRVVPPGGSPSNPPQPPSATMPSQAQQQETKMPSSQQQSQQSQQQMYNGSASMNVPQQQVYGNMQQDANTVNGVPLRKPGETTSLSFVVDGMGSQQQGQMSASVAPVEEQRDPLDTTGAAAVATTGVSAAAAASSGAAVGESDGAEVQATPFGNLNVGQQQQQNGQPVNTVGRRATMKPSWTQTPRILVVEDDLVYRQLSSKFLEKFGCVVETVENAQQGIEKMNKTKYDLVLMDIFFGPSMDGRKATSLIRQFDMYTPIISMTSNVQSKDVDSYIQSGMNDVLAKPFTKHGLFCILDKHLIHLKAIQLSGEVPRFLGVPPLSDQGVADALATSVSQWNSASNGEELSNPLAGSGWSDDQYQLVIQQLMTTGAVPDPNGGTFIATGAVPNGSNFAGLGVIGTSVVFPGPGLTMSRKRSIEIIDDDWEEQAKKRPANASTMGQAQAAAQAQAQAQQQMSVGASVSEMA